MAIYDLFSRRQKRQQGDLPDVYSYDDIPNALRVQIIHIWDDALGNKPEYENSSLKVKNAYRNIVASLCREYGMFTLAGFTSDESRHFRYELQAFFLSEADYDRLIDVIELTFMTIDQKTRTFDYKRSKNHDKLADRAIEELNMRLRGHAVGYQFVEGMMVRIDSEFIHSELIKPTLRVLNNKHFKDAEQEFLLAHYHYRNGKYKKALVKSLISLKIMIKSICDKNAWLYEPKGSTKDLLKVCFDNGLVPNYWQPNINNLVNMLEKGFPVEKKKRDTETVPDYFAAYLINLTASALMFLGDADKL